MKKFIIICKRMKVRRVPSTPPPTASVRVIEAVPVEIVSKSIQQAETVPPVPSKRPVRPAVWDELKGLE